MKFLTVLTSSSFLSDISHISKLSLKLFFEDVPDKVELKNYCVSLQPLQSLKELTILITYRTVSNTYCRLKVVDFPPSLEVLD